LFSFSSEPVRGLESDGKVVLGQVNLK